MPDFDPHVRTYHEHGDAAARPSGNFPSGRSTSPGRKRSFERYLPSTDLDILDVGGGVTDDSRIERRRVPPPAGSVVAHNVPFSRAGWFASSVIASARYRASPTVTSGTR